MTIKCTKCGIKWIVAEDAAIDPAGYVCMTCQARETRERALTKIRLERMERLKQRNAERIRDYMDCVKRRNLEDASARAESFARARAIRHGGNKQSEARAKHDRMQR